TSKIDREKTDNISLFFVNLSIPIVKIGAFPFNAAIDIIVNFQELIDAEKQNEILRKENEKLKSLYLKAININRENEDLKETLNFIGLKSAKYKTAELVAKPNQLYSQNVFI